MSRFRFRYRWKWISLILLLASCRPLRQDSSISAFEVAPEKYLFATLFEFSGTDLCFTGTDIYLEVDTVSNSDQTTLTELSEIQVLAILNQVRQEIKPCIGDWDLSLRPSVGIALELPSFKSLALAPIDKLAGGVVNLGRLAGQVERIHIPAQTGVLKAAKSTFHVAYRNGKVSQVALRPTLASGEFLAQQKANFAQEGPREVGARLFRYFMGQKQYRRPVESFGKVLNPAKGEIPRGDEIEFGQASVTMLFSQSGKLGVKTEIIDGEIEGRSLMDVAADLRLGKLKVEDLKVKVYKYLDKFGRTHWVTINNRTTAAIRMAGKEPKNIRVFSLDELAAKGDDHPNGLRAVLNRLVAMPEELPSKVTYVRVDGVDAAGNSVRNWDWSAPFGFKVGGSP